jgi:HAE1 family hydrophobic/amphiphilic exporter-1
MSLFSALLGVYLTAGDNNIFTQIGLFVLVGLACKNAILIVEFARELEMRGVPLIEAAIESSRLRLRPVLMTSFAFIAGLIPLVLATGPGAIGNRTIGSSALGGMLIGTLGGVIVIPGLYYLFAKIASGRKLIKGEDENPLTEEIDHNV